MFSLFNLKYKIPYFWPCRWIVIEDLSLLNAGQVVYSEFIRAFLLKKTKTAWTADENSENSQKNKVRGCKTVLPGKTAESVIPANASKQHMLIWQSPPKLLQP